MELIIVVVMILLGGGLAAAIAVAAAAINRAEQEREATQASATPSRESIAASLVYHIASLGVNDPAMIMGMLREAGLVAPITRNVHVSSWAEAFRRASTSAQREELLDLAVRAAVALNTSIPLQQYNALLDLSFGLGFQTDALARLRARYRFEYTDHAKAARPITADRSGGAAPLFERRQSSDPEVLLNVLGLSGDVSRQLLTSTYRRLAAQNHPDRFHNATTAEQEHAAARFIEITEAYEKLILMRGEE